jgi:hypothetical protein
MIRFVAEVVLLVASFMAGHFYGAALWAWIKAKLHL